MKTYYCWKCQTEMPFLDEDEWQQVSPLLADAIREIQHYRAEHQCDFTDGKKARETGSDEKV